MKRIPPVGIPGIAGFKLKHIGSFGVISHPDHPLVAIVYTVGAICDKLEADFPGFVINFKEWKKAGQYDPKVKKEFKEALPPCLSACHTSLCWLVASLRKRAESHGEEKIRHADWLDQQLSGAVLTEEQIAEIKHAIFVVVP